MSLQVHSWPLAQPKRKLESRFRRRASKHGELAIIPRAELVRLIERAETTTRQLELPLDLRDSPR